jgi:hypothetical protein
MLVLYCVAGRKTGVRPADSSQLSPISLVHTNHWITLKTNARNRISVKHHNLLMNSNMTQPSPAKRYVTGHDDHAKAIFKAEGEIPYTRIPEKSGKDSLFGVSRCFHVREISAC